MKVAVLGPIAKDNIKIDDNLSTQIGGIPYYIALALKALAVEKITPYITCATNDSKWVCDNFNGLEVKCLPAEKTIESNLKYSSRNPDVRESLIKSYPNTIEPDKKLLKELEEYDYIIFGPLFHDNIPFEIFEKLKHKNLVLGNFGVFTYNEEGKFIKKNPENLIKVLPFVDYLFLDKNEAKFVSAEKDVKEASKFLKEHGCDNIIITDGSKGSHLFLKEKYYQIPAFAPKKIIDPTGAGDTYLAAFIRSLELFDNPEEQGRFAAMVATMSLEEKGAFRGSIQETKDRLGE